MYSQDVTPTVSNQYTIAYLWDHPSTRDIMRSHLASFGGTPESLASTLPDLEKYNMGGGIPHEVITKLSIELDAVGYPLPEWTDMYSTRFDEQTRAKLGFYVYMLLDPDTKKPFYVGKGVNTRVFAHVTGHAGALDPEGMKYEKITEIRAKGRLPDHVIVRHGMDEDTALEVESALIDTLRSLDFDMTNVVDGHHADDRGLMTAGEIIRKYRAVELDQLGDDCVIINISRKYKRGFTDEDIYEAAKEAWVIAKARLADLKYVLVEYRGLIVAVYEVERWYEVLTEYTDKKSDAPRARIRYGFDGHKAPDEVYNLYINKSIAHHKKQGQASPVRFKL